MMSTLHSHVINNFCKKENDAKTEQGEWETIRLAIYPTTQVVESFNYKRSSLTVK